MTHSSLSRTLVIGLSSLVLFGAARGEGLHLKPEINVSGDTIRLDQLIDGLEQGGDVAVFRAPQPGGRGTIRTERILEAALELGISGIEPGTIRSVTIHRPARSISRNDMQDAIAKSAMARATAGNIAVTLDENIKARVIDAQYQDRIEITSLTRDAATGRFEARIMLPGAAEGRESWVVTGLMLETRDILVPVADLDRGDAIQAKDLALVKRPVAQIGQDILLTKDNLVGMQPRRVLRAGEPIRASDLAKPLLVEKNQIVSVVYVSKSLSISMRGRADTGGAMGDTIKVQNPQSKRMVEGVVSGLGQVTITTLPSPTPALAEATLQAK